jgi:hypothetical protein
VAANWDRTWYEFAAEWPEVELEDASWEASATQVLHRFLRGHVFATFEQMQDWSRWSSRALKRLVSEMEHAQRIVPRVMAGYGEGWLCGEDADLPDQLAEASVFMLHKSDPLVRSHGSELKRRFGRTEVLQYLLIDGGFQGAVLGHWRIGPHDVEDVVVELPTRERQQRQGEILQAIAQQYEPPRHHILKYDGRDLAAP